MSDYYDNKGVRHSSEWDRDSANRGYLSEERDARDKQTDLLQQQAQLQAEQLRLAEQREREQRAHNDLVEALAREEAAEAQTASRPGGPPPQTAVRDRTPDSSVSDRFGRIPLRCAAADFTAFIRLARALHFTFPSAP